MRAAINIEVRARFEKREAIGARARASRVVDARRSAEHASKTLAALSRGRAHARVAASPPLADVRDVFGVVTVSLRPALPPRTRSRSRHRLGRGSGGFPRAVGVSFPCYGLSFGRGGGGVWAVEYLWGAPGRSMKDQLPDDIEHYSAEE